MRPAGRRGLAAVGLLLTLLLAACGSNQALLSNVTATSPDAAGSAAANVIQPAGRRPTAPIQLAYTLGQPASVTLQIQPAAGGAPIMLRHDPAKQPAGAHFVLFNGVVPTGAPPGRTATQVSRVLADGRYHFTIAATPDGGPAQQASADFQVQGAQTTVPGLENLQIYPAAISPNGDAIDDVAQITYRLSETSTAGVTLQSASGPPVTIQAPVRTPAGEQRVIFNGQDLLGRAVPNGIYTVTVRVADVAGNAVEAQRPLTISDSGKPNIAVREVKITPPALMLGGKLHVHLVVQNTGRVPLRTQGPDSGYTYTTNDSYANIAGGRYVDRAGLWRVGLDWAGNAGGAPYRYPFRWGFGPTLAPGATATIEGDIVILKQERTMWFFAGVLQEGVTIALDQLGTTPIQVSW